MAYIGLKNFRKFESLDRLDLNDINIFVGKNNAGKSTVVKAIMLVLDNLRDLRWQNVPKEIGFYAMDKAPVPLFRFDANSFHNLHIATFDRAKCNYIEDKQIVFQLGFSGIEFEITVAGNIGENLVYVPIQIIKITINDRFTFEIDFSQNIMRVEISYTGSLDQEKIDDTELLTILAQLQIIKDELNKAMEASDALKVAQIQSEYSKLQRLQKAKEIPNNTDEKSNLLNVTFDLTYFHENIGENILVQYFRTLLKVIDDKVIAKGITGTTTNIGNELKKGTIEHNAEIERRQIIEENRDLVKTSEEKLEAVLNNINLDYIQAHTASQKLILSAEERQDINSRVVHEYFQEGSQSGDIADRFLTKWLKKFGIADSICIMPLDGEGYYVKVNKGNATVHLADMGMGSIQLIILLLRLVTIGNRISNGGQPWWIIIEEPEQNIHPMLQSLLAEMFKDFQETFKSLLIIETHSEYLIRKTQLILAEKELQSDEDLSDWNMSVYYFPIETDQQPYDMIYQYNGLFANRFDSGFFDEASKIHMEILKRSRLNKY